MRLRKSIQHKCLKGAVMAYVRYLIAHDVLPPEQEKILRSVYGDSITIIHDGAGVQYYKDLPTLRSAIQTSVSRANCYDDAIYDKACVALYLAWFGLTEQEIVDYPKTDVLDDGIMIHGQKHTIPDDVLRVFIRLRDGEGFYQLAKGPFFHRYIPSQYLIRTTRSAHSTVPLLRSIISRLNIVCDKRYSLTYNVVYQSGIFHRVYQMECEGFQFDFDDPAVASRVFCEELSVGRNLFSRVRDYRIYKQLFN